MPEWDINSHCVSHFVRHKHVLHLELDIVETQWVVHTFLPDIGKKGKEHNVHVD